MTVPYILHSALSILHLKKEQTEVCSLQYIA